MNTARILGTAQSFSVGKIVCVGRNYIQHAKEMKADVPKEPVLFLKPATAIIHDGGEIVMPSISNDVHHEVELIVLIGKGGKEIAESRALGHVAGYGVGLDMTLRDVQDEAKKKGLPWTLAKGFDTSAGVSEFVPASSAPDPGNLRIRLSVNDAERQSTTTGNLIFPVAVLVTYISQYFTLEPGDIVFTGTPEGVARVRSGDRLHAELQTSAGKALVSLNARVR